MLLYSWPLIGAVIGALAAHMRGFSIIGGVAGGFLLGPFAVFMFFVSSVSGEASRICPHCAERINAAAVVCKHCGRDVPPPAARKHKAGAKVGCPTCSKTITVGDATCRHCGAALVSESR